jgi:two-component system sensor histidine kinase YesM
MSRWRSIFQKQPYTSMFVKLFLSLTVASLIIFSGLFYFSLNGFKDAFYKQKADDMNLYTERTGQFLDMYFQNVRNILLETSRNLEESMLQEEPLQGEKVLSRTLELNKGIISQMYALTPNGHVLSSNSMLYSTIDHPQLKDIFRIVDENPGLINWSQPYYSPLLVDYTVAFALAITNTSGQKIGTLLAEINTPLLTEQLSKLLNTQEKSYVLFSAQGQLISYQRNSSLLPYQLTTVPKELDTEFVQQLWNLGNGVNLIQGGEDALLSFKSNRNDLGWYLVTMTGEQYFLQSVSAVIKQFIGISMIWFTLLVVITYMISRYFIRPVKLLAVQMDRVNGDLLVNPVNTELRNDEIGDLTRSYHLLIDRIRGLVDTVREKEEKKKEMELKMLLSQIRPHFLYNTLACIGSLAKQHRVQEVEETIYSLILILTVSIDKKTEAVPLSEELDTLQAYVQILKIRYGDTFRFTIEVPDAHLDMVVPKMILQPLVENALFHGIVNKEGGEIRVSSTLSDNCFILTVQDDGEGMNLEQTQSFQMGLFAASRTHLKGLNNIGLTNIAERIKLLYGPEYGLQIRSTLGLGTEVDVLLPHQEIH